MNPFVFLVGCPRSGTTLLQRILNAHPQIAIPPESYWIARWFESRRCLTPEGLVTPKLARRLSEFHWFAEVGISRKDMESLIAPGEPLSWAAFVSRVLDLYGTRDGKSLVGDKTPNYVRKIGMLHDLFPHAKFVHLIRDGRDICLSMLDWEKSEASLGRFSTWREDRVSTTALYWSWYVRLGREAAQWLSSEQYYEIRYESLVVRPADECAALCAFLGVPYDHAMLRFHEGRTRTETGLNAKDAWLPITRGLRDWRSQMREEDVERFETAADKLIDELGYSRAVPRPNAELQQRACRLRDMFSEEVRARGKLLPQHW